MVKFYTVLPLFTNLETDEEEELFKSVVLSTLIINSLDSSSIPTPMISFTEEHINNKISFMFKNVKVINSETFRHNIRSHHI